MTYLAWSLFAEGNTDFEYFSIILPRLINDLIQNQTIRSAEVPETPVMAFRRRPGGLAAVAEEVCRAQGAFHLLFVHGDTGGRNLERGVDDRVGRLCELVRDICGLTSERCVCVVPRHETEAWCLADQNALRRAIGLSQNYTFNGLPRRPSQVENLNDPKLVANSIMNEAVRGTKRRARPFPLASVANEQDLGVLRTLPSFLEMEADLKRALGGLGFPELRE